jgi:hypothetical protein
MLFNRGAAQCAPTFFLLRRCSAIVAAKLLRKDVWLFPAPFLNFAVQRFSAREELVVLRIGLLRGAAVLFPTSLS